IRVLVSMAGTCNARNPRLSGPPRERDRRSSPSADQSTQDTPTSEGGERDAFPAFSESGQSCQDLSFAHQLPPVTRPTTISVPISTSSKSFTGPPGELPRSRKNRCIRQYKTSCLNLGLILRHSVCVVKGPFPEKRQISMKKLSGCQGTEPMEM